MINSVRIHNRTEKNSFELERGGIWQTVQDVYCTFGYSLLILDFTWIQGLPVHNKDTINTKRRCVYIWLLFFFMTKVARPVSPHLNTNSRITRPRFRQMGRNHLVFCCLVRIWNGDLIIILLGNERRLIACTLWIPEDRSVLHKYYHFTLPKQYLLAM